MTQRYNWLMACCLLPACGSGEAKAPPNGPTWRGTGGETTDFGGNDAPVCTSELSPIERERAIALGFDPDADLAELEGTSEADFLWWEERCLTQGPCEPTRFTLSARFESMELMSSRPVDGVIVPEGECYDELYYRLLIDLTAADGSISGSFLAGVLSGIGKHTDGLWRAYGEPALDAFTGTRELLVDEGRPHWSRFEVGLILGGSPRASRGSMTPWIIYTDGREPREHAASPTGVWSSQAEPQGYDEWLPPKNADRVSLDGYSGSREPPTFRVEVHPHPETPGASLVLAVNGEVSTYEDVALDQFLDVGRLKIGDIVSADLTTPNARSGTSIRVGDCTWVWGKSCATPGCTAHTEATVEPVRCMPRLPGVYD